MDDIRPRNNIRDIYWMLSLQNVSVVKMYAVQGNFYYMSSRAYAGMISIWYQGKKVLESIPEGFPMIDFVGVFKSYKHDKAIILLSPKSIILENTDAVWMGGSDDHHEGLWLWVDGRQADIFSNFWGYNSPQASSSNNCMKASKLSNSYTVARVWLNDEKCSAEYNFVSSIYNN
ncbi:unnamed protein product, partial [Meganyctiphanes norvegica]